MGWIILLSLIGALLLVSRIVKKFANPYKLYMIFGKKGSGKTTLLTKLALQYIQKGYPVYTTIPVPGARLFKAEQIGDFVFPEEAVIFVDEVGIIWDNRNYKNFRPEVRDYFKFQRQYRNTVYLFSQTFDIDLKLRNLTDGMFLCKCYGNIFSVARRISRSITIISATAESESRIADDLQVEPIAGILFGSQPFLLTFIPKWAKYFNSFAPPKREFVPYKQLPAVELPTFKSQVTECAGKLKGKLQSVSLRPKKLKKLPEHKKSSFENWNPDDFPDDYDS